MPTRSTTGMQRRGAVRGPEPMSFGRFARPRQQHTTEVTSGCWWMDCEAERFRQRQKAKTDWGRFGAMLVTLPNQIDPPNSFPRSVRTDPLPIPKPPTESRRPS